MSKIHLCDKSYLYLVITKARWSVNDLFYSAESVITMEVSGLNYLNIYQTSNTRRNQNLKRICFSFRVASCLCPIQWSQVLSRESWCSWRSVDRRCSNFIWVINKFIAYLGATYIRGLRVCLIIPLLDIWGNLHGCIYLHIPTNWRRSHFLR